MTTSAIVNLGPIVTGSLVEPLLEAEAILLEGDRIAAIGRRSELDLDRAEVVVDAGGATLAPGLIDSHCHPVIGDYTPRQKTVDFLASYAHGGIARVISAGEMHAPGRPKDPAGVKALALIAQRCFLHYRPGGVTVHAGSLILEPGLVESDFAQLAAEGVWLAKAGFGAFARPTDCAPMVRWAQRHGFVVTVHTGGASIPGSSIITADDLLEMAPDVSGHINGGPTALPAADTRRVIEQSTMALQIIQSGNLRSALEVTRILRDQGRLDRLLIGSDTPTGTGVIPLAIIKSAVELASLAPLPPELALAAATGTVGQIFRLDAGRIAPGCPADLILIDAPSGSAADDALGAMAIGDIPAIACLFTEGELRYVLSRNTPPPTRAIRLVEDRTRRTF